MILAAIVLVRALCLLVVSVSSADAAFRPPLLSEELGCSPTLSLLLGRPDGFFFDPLRLAKDDNFARLREAELKHGRICMAANLGLTIPALLERMMKEEFGQIMNVPSGGDGEQHFPSASIIENLTSLSPTQILNMLVTCGFLEAFIFFQRDPKDMPGDYGTGYFGVRDKGINERSLVAELENGRLAMLAIAGQLVAEVVSGQSWLEQWDGILRQILARAVEVIEGASQMADAVVVQ